MLPYIATYLLITALLAAADRFADRPLFIRTYSKHFPWKLNYSFGWWGAQEYCAAATMVSIAGLIFIFFWHLMGGGFNRDAGQALFVPISLGSTLLAIRHFRLVEKFKAHSWWFTIAAVLPTIGLGIYANAYADAYILQLTRVDASKFPLAQKALTTILLISLWAFIGTVLVSFIVFIVLFFIAASTQTFTGMVKRDPVNSLAWKKYAPGVSEHRRSAMLLAVFIGSLTTVSIAMSFLEYVTHHLDEVLQETLIFSSFHLNPRDCGIPGWTNEAWVALIGDGRGVLAASVKHGYTFETVTCEVQSQKTLQMNRIRRLRSDDYF